MGEWDRIGGFAEWTLDCGLDHPQTLSCRLAPCQDSSFGGTSAGSANF
jgi:hypothetical protein